MTISRAASIFCLISASASAAEPITGKVVRVHDGHAVCLLDL